LRRRGRRRGTGGVLEQTRKDVETFAQVWTRLAEELSPPTPPAETSETR
jgi:hypothetical protein